MEASRTDLRLAAVADLDARALDSLTVAGYRDYRQVLAWPAIAAVSIATPPSTHYQLALESLEAGKHVLVEKPPTLTVAESRSLIERSSQLGLVLFMAFHARYHTALERVRQELAHERVVSVRATFREDVYRFHAHRHQAKD